MQVIAQVAASGIRAKSGIMLGLGETEADVYKTMDDLISIGCEVFTLGNTYSRNVPTFRLPNISIRKFFRNISRPDLKKVLKLLRAGISEVIV